MRALSPDAVVDPKEQNPELKSSKLFPY